MAPRQVVGTQHENQTRVEQDTGFGATHDVNGSRPVDNSNFSYAQINTYPSRIQTRSVRKGSVIASREDTVLEYQSHHRDVQGNTRPNPSSNANDMTPLENWPSHARRNRTQIENENGEQRKGGRGVLKGIKVSKKRFANGSGKLNVQFSDRLGGSVGMNYRSFVDDVVVYMKRRAPLIEVQKWFTSLLTRALLRMFFNAGI